MRKKHLTYRQTGGILLGYEEEVSASHLDCNHAVGLIIDKYALTVCLLKRITYYPLFLLWRYETISKENQINEEIRDKELRVIDNDGTQLGIMSLNEALDLAAQKKLDLVNIAPKAKPPVCKILDYGKYKYELQKKEKEAKKKQKTMQVKEIRLSTFIETHDVEVKAKNASKFLKAGDKVKVSLRFRGRERDYTAKGMDVMNQFAEIVSDVAEVEKKPNFEGRSLMMVLAPKTDKK
jgi:translation initiation factor IF-3